MVDATTSELRKLKASVSAGEEIADTVLDIIGNTPLVRLHRVVPEGSAEVLGKLESNNPGGSVKDRIALSMIEDAEATGRLKANDTIVEPTAGTSASRPARVAAVRGYGLYMVIPEDMSGERRTLLSRFRAELVLTPAIEGMSGAVFAAQELVEKHGYFMAQQFDNPANPEVHRRTTAPEILKATGGRLDALVTGVGTGGTITGVGEVLKEHDPNILVVAVEPAASPVLAGGKAGLTGIQGIGASFVPSVLNRDIYDELIAVTDEEAYEMTLRLTKEEGLLVGISAGANVHASLQVAERLGTGKRIVTTLCDTGERYLSVNL